MTTKAEADRLERLADDIASDLTPDAGGGYFARAFGPHAIARAAALRALEAGGTVDDARAAAAEALADRG